MATPRLHPRTLLLVEDDDAHAMVEQRALEEAGGNWEIRRLRDGDEAIRYLRREGVFADCARPHLILIDLRLPKTDGHEVIRFVKCDRSLSSIPIVVLSTSESMHDRRRAYANYANGYLVKPSSLEELNRMMRDLTAFWSQWNTVVDDADGKAY